MNELQHHYSKNLKSILDGCLAIIFITASFDIVLNIKYAGFSLRACTLLMVVFSFFVFFISFFSKKKTTIRFLGFGSFLIWFSLLLLFVQNSILLTRGIGYMAWLTIFMLFIIALADYVQTIAHFKKILYLYVNSFTIIGAFAIFQFLTTLFGLDLLITFYFTSGVPRIHGLSYEPSYFSTYLIIPWCFHIYIFFTDFNAFKKKTFNIPALIILTTAILMSLSRMGLVLMFFIIAIKFLFLIKKLVIFKKISLQNLYFFTVTFLGVLFLIIVSILNIDKFLSLLEGLPIFSRYTHSLALRFKDFVNTWKVFVDSPMIGCSLGGVAPSIAKNNGFNNITQEIVKQNEGMCIFLEVLAASGFIGFLFFIFFLKRILFSFRELKKKIQQGISSKADMLLSIHRFLIISFIFQIFLLCLNQNILRNYFWIHIAVINLSFFVLKNSFIKQAR